MPRRLPSIDALRGLVMVIMALDHTREFFHSGAMAGINPEDIARTTTAVFFTRWITNLCAPTFFFLAGLSASLSTREKPQLSRYLFTRGLWLIFLELTVFRFAIFFRLDAGPVLLTILWALGLAMIALAALIHIPPRWLAPLSLAVIALHNLADPIRLSGPAQILHQVGVFQFAGLTFISVYTLVPWFAVMAIGYCARPLLNDTPKLLKIGAAATAGFILLRAINIYGEPTRWDGTFLSFLRCTKYPPSLDFLLMTLGPALLLLGLFQRWNPPILSTYGRQPLFYFITHFFLIHLLTFPIGYLKYGTVGFLLNPPPSVGGSPAPYPAGYGYTLLETYGVWILVVAIMYPLVKLRDQRSKTPS